MTSRFPFLALALGLTLLVTACAPKVIPPSSLPPLPPKGTAIPKGGRVPATQRPYEIDGKAYYPIPSAEGYEETGIASWYGYPFHGRKTSNGETYDMHELTAAHKILPMHTPLLVKNLDNGRELTVRVNDRGPFVKDRIIDLSFRAATELDVVRTGTARVRITALGEAVKTVEGGVTTTRFVETRNFQEGDFYVQVGAFKVTANAERLRDRLLREGRQAVVFDYPRGDEVFHRVQVKGGNTLSAAKQMERVMVEAGFPGAYVVAR
ncbi:MAG: septal ring lytic transglycosylase RlpA family protein [Thermodesulfobacteriota bacterium]